jgi:hypothetical protein
MGSVSSILMDLNMFARFDMTAWFGGPRVGLDTPGATRSAADHAFANLSFKCAPLFALMALAHAAHPHVETGEAYRCRTMCMRHSLLILVYHGTIFPN